MSANHGKKIVVCIPAFNESSSISSVIRSSLPHCSEVIVYDDGSVDGTKSVAESAGAHVIRSPLNRGYGVAIKSLFQTASAHDADIVVTLDADGQHDPEQILEIVRPIIQDDFDIVIGSRFLNKHDREMVPRYRSIGVKAITKFTQAITYNNITDAQCGFRAYSRKAVSRMMLTEEGMSVSTEILLRAKQSNLSIKEIPITIRYGPTNSSKRNPLSHGIGIIYSVFQFMSIKHPLLCYGLPGISLLIIAFLYMTWSVDLYSATKYISTNMILVSVGSAIVGVVLLATGSILHAMGMIIRMKPRDF